jgi:hypothetical protein
MLINVRQRKTLSLKPEADGLELCPSSLRAQTKVEIPLQWLAESSIELAEGREALAG